MRKNDYRVLHDIVGEGFNIDHVVLSIHGIFCIETKTWSKKIRDEKIFYDGINLTIPGRTIDRDPIIQVKAAASWLKRLLEETTGKSFPMRPVVLFPGWYVDDSKRPRNAEVWVLEPKSLPGFIEKERATLPMDDVRLATYHISRYIRTTKS